jgi:hypothetical protein
MGFDIHFRYAEGAEEKGDLAKFLLLQPFNYPGYEFWVKRCHDELVADYKRAIICLNNGHLVGDLIFQQHKTFSTWLELKNVRVDSRFQRRLVFSFMLRQAEYVAGKEGYLAMICDARSDRTDVLKILRTAGYSEIARVALYESDVEDIVMGK